MIEFGPGTIGTGKPRGFANPEVAAANGVRALLERAFSRGGRYAAAGRAFGEAAATTEKSLTE